jgi:hypothetical protein
MKLTTMKKTACLLALNLFLLPFFALAMQSQTYRINADTINSGGDLSGSASYHLGDTLGEAATGEERSANFKSKTAFWYMLPAGSQLGLSCEANTVYMADYTLGNAGNANMKTYSVSESCDIDDNSSAPWALTMQSTNMTSAKNNLSNANVLLQTDNNVSSGNTITDRTTGITESSLVDPSGALNTPETVISGDVTASGIYKNRPTVKLKNLNSLFNETISGTITITIQ